MEVPFSNETLSTIQNMKEVPSPRPMSRRIKALFLVVEIAAFAAMLAAFIGLLLRYTESANDASWSFLANLALFIVPLFVLSVVMGINARFMERESVQKAYQARLDQIHNRLQYREDLLKLVANHQPGAMTIFDRHNRYWFVNEQQAKQLDKEVDAIVGQSPAKVLGVEKAKKLEVRLAEARAAEKPMNVMERIVEKNGETRFVQMRFESIAPFAEQSNCVMVTEEDMTDLIVERERRERMFRQVIDTLVAVVDRRDPYASGHSARVGQLSRAIAEEMKLTQTEIDASEIAGSLMNFGKVLVSRQILTKTTTLTAEELQRVRDSILTSADILAIIGFEGPVVPTLRQVLEQYDGSGVPNGLKGDEIIITARIVAVANAFVAFVSPRAHRDGLSFADALGRMMEDASKRYDHKVLVALANYIENRPNKLDWLKVARPSFHTDEAKDI